MKGLQNYYPQKIKSLCSVFSDEQINESIEMAKTIPFWEHLLTCLY